MEQPNQCCAQSSRVFHACLFYWDLHVATTAVVVLLQRRLSSAGSPLLFLREIACYRWEDPVVAVCGVPYITAYTTEENVCVYHTNGGYNTRVMKYCKSQKPPPDSSPGYVVYHTPYGVMPHNRYNTPNIYVPPSKFRARARQQTLPNRGRLWSISILHVVPRLTQPYLILALAPPLEVARGRQGQSRDSASMRGGMAVLLSPLLSLPRLLHPATVCHLAPRVCFFVKLRKTTTQFITGGRCISHPWSIYHTG